MDTVSITQFILAFVFVIGLIGLFALLLKRFANPQTILGAKGDGRIRIVEIRYLDPKRRLILVRRDDVEHLLLLSDGREVVVETSIPAGKGSADHD